jgi:hypothetical protein
MQQHDEQPISKEDDATLRRIAQEAYNHVARSIYGSAIADNHQGHAILMVLARLTAHAFEDNQGWQADAAEIINSALDANERPAYWRMKRIGPQ